MKISTKLNLLSIFSISGYLFLFIYTSFSIETIFESMQNIHQADRYLNSLNSCDTLLLKQLAEGQKILLSNTATVNGDALVELRLKKAVLSQKIEEIKTMAVPDGINKNTELIGELITLYKAIDTELIKKIFNNEKINSAEVSELIMSDYQRLQNRMADYEKEIDLSIVFIVKKNKNIIKRFNIIFSVLFLIMTVILLLTVFFIKYSVLKTIKHASEQMAMLSKGKTNLDFRFKRISKDEVGELCNGFNSFLSNMEQMMVKIKNAGDITSDLGNRLENDIQSNLALSNDLQNNFYILNNYFENLSSAITKTNEIVSEIHRHSNESKVINREQQNILVENSANIEHTTENLSLIRKAEHQNIENTAIFAAEAREGYKIISEINSGIEEILKAAGSLLSINDVIEDIAGKTSILGINAAIEASRAGSDGRGFKVISEEIGNLASTVKHNAVKTDQNLKNVISLISNLKTTNESGMTKFRYIEQNSAAVYDSMKSVTEQLDNLESNEKNMLESLKKLTENGVRINSSVLMMDENISRILSAINLLGKDFSCAAENISSVSRGAEELGSLTSKLSSIGKENLSISELLLSYISYFSCDV